MQYLVASEIVGVLLPATWGLTMDSVTCHSSDCVEFEQTCRCSASRLAPCACLLGLHPPRRLPSTVNACWSATAAAVVEVVSCVAAERTCCSWHQLLLPITYPLLCCRCCCCCVRFEDVLESPRMATFSSSMSPSPKASRSIGLAGPSGQVREPRGEGVHVVVWQGLQGERVPSGQVC